MVLDKVRKSENNLYKVIIISFLLFLIFIFISLLLLFVSPYFLYGTLYGGAFLFTSLLIIYFIHRYISFGKHTYIFTFSIFFTRSLLLLTALLILFLLINVDQEKTMNQFSQPINFFFFFFVFLFYNISNVLVSIFDKMI